MHQTMAPRRRIPPNSKVVRRLDFGNEEKNMQGVYDNILNSKREVIMSYTEKYNFDFENEKALPGKYEWMMRNDLDKWIIMDVQDISHVVFSGRVTSPQSIDISTAEITPVDTTATVTTAEKTPTDTTAAVAAAEKTPADTTATVAAAEKTPADTTAVVAATETALTDPTCAATVEMTPTHSPATADAADYAPLKKRAMPRDDRTFEKCEIAKDDKTLEKRKISRHDHKNLVKKRLRME